jgi:hypothetical protein
MEINEYVVKYAEDLKRRLKEAEDFPKSSPPYNSKWANNVECVLYVALDQFQSKELDYLSEASDQIRREMESLANSINQQYPNYNFEDWVHWAYWSTE